MNGFQKHYEEVAAQMAEIMIKLDPLRSVEDCQSIARDFVLAKFALKISQAQLALEYSDREVEI